MKLSIIYTAPSGPKLSLFERYYLYELYRFLGKKCRRVKPAFAEEIPKRILSLPS